MDAVEAAPVEADDPFAGGGGDDPFAGGEPQAGDPPVVDKEGVPVETQPLPSPEQPAEGDEGGDAAPEPPAASNGAQTGGEGDGKAKSPMRRYRLLYQTAQDQWTEAVWQDNGKSTRIVEARNNDHALRLAFGILGEPENGVTVLPVPDSSFKPKKLKKKQVMPRTALDIS